ncbi:DUF1491 family protein [Skermanella mucosa]|uniref:DUF1491 family protein n=1 Tax=Skermanella mucosa TaxID=1789672 RepID=UPI00192C8AED|nr:DUF1491 family protein [Skermanella mucosa]UEM22816.1 DUF1491 family protein [Skermanella mucosa]
MDDDRIPTELWVRAHVRRCIAEAIPAVIARKGSPYGGLVMLKLNQLEHGCRVLTQTRDMDGKTAWLAAKENALMPETDADAYIERAVKRDPDLWVIEIEDRAGRHPFEGKVL